MTRSFGVLLLAALAAPSIALAADEDPPLYPTATATATATPAPEASPSPVATPNPFETATPPREEPGHAVSPWGLAVGLGWVLPADLGTPNNVSLRIRRGTFALEPSVSLVASGDWSKTRAADESETVDRTGGWTTTVSLGARKRLGHRSPVALVGILTPSATFTELQENPEGTDNAVRSTSFSLGASWGLGVEYSPLPSWTLSLDATNLIYDVTWSRVYAMAPNASAQQTAFSAGLVLDPTVRAMFHLHF